MKKLWQNKRKKEGKPYDKPNMVMNSAVQVCWEVSAQPSLANRRLAEAPILT
jgi:glutamate decarboxylase